MQAEVSRIYLVNVKLKNVLLQINLNLRRSEFYVKLLCIELHKSLSVFLFFFKMSFIAMSSIYFLSKFANAYYSGLYRSGNNYVVHCCKSTA